MAKDSAAQLLKLVLWSIHQSLPYRKESLTRELRVNHIPSQIAQSQHMISLYRRALAISQLMHRVELANTDIKSGFQNVDLHCREQLMEIQNSMVALPPSDGRWVHDGIKIVEETQQWVIRSLQELGRL